MLYAILYDNIVIEIKEISDEDISAVAANSQMIININGMEPQPQVGWSLDGNKLSPKAQLEQTVANAITFGRALKAEVTAKIGARNLLLGKTEQEISTLVSQLISIGFLLEGGALKTARSSIEAIKPLYPDHAQELDYAITKITSLVGP